MTRSMALILTLCAMIMAANPASAGESGEGLGAKFGIGLGLSLSNSSAGVGGIYHVSDNLAIRASFNGAGDMTGFAAWALYYARATDDFKLYAGPGYASFEGPEVSGPGYSASTSGSGLALTGGGQYNLSKTIKNLHGFVEFDYWMFKLKGEASAKAEYAGYSYKAKKTYEADVSDVDIVLGIIYYF